MADCTHNSARRFGILIVATALLSVGGCGGGGGTAVTPGIPPAGHYNTYLGTQVALGKLVSGALAYSGGVWGMTFDTDTNYFSYNNTSALSAPDPSNPGQNLPSQGSSSNAAGFLKLSLNPKGNGGYGIEIPGRGVLLRPGDNTVSPVVAVETNACNSFPADSVFQFVTLGVNRIGIAQFDSTVYGSYGSLQMTSSGTTWSFSNYGLFTVDGTALNPAQLPSGSCGTTKDGYAISVLPSKETKNLPLTIATGPSGLFVLDQGQAVLVQGANNSFAPTAPDATGPFGLAGVIMPVSALNTSDVAAAKYAGFKFDTLSSSLISTGLFNSSTPVSAPVAFGQAAASGTAMMGGEFPNDDVTKAPAANIKIDFGPQDTHQNGLYKSVTVTIPDPQNACVARAYGGTDGQGNPTCTLHGVAVVGNPEGKYAVFMTLSDSRALAFGLAPTALEFFLYQQ